MALLLVHHRQTDGLPEMALLLENILLFLPRGFWSPSCDHVRIEKVEDLDMVKSSLQAIVHCVVLSCVVLR